MTDEYCLEDTMAQLTDKQREKIEELIEQRDSLIAALRKIAGDHGPFSKEHPFEHARNIIFTMEELAKDALDKIYCV